MHQFLVWYIDISTPKKLQGFNATLTDRVDTPNGCQGNQIREMDLKLHPDLKETLTRLCGDPKTTIIILSGSGRGILDEVRLFLYIYLGSNTLIRI